MKQNIGGEKGRWCDTGDLDGLVVEFYGSNLGLPTKMRGILRAQSGKAWKFSLKFISSIYQMNMMHSLKGGDFPSILPPFR